MVLGEFFDAIDEAPTTGVRCESLGVGRNRLEIGDDVDPIDPHRMPRKARWVVQAKWGRPLKGILYNLRAPTPMIQVCTDALG